MIRTFCTNKIRKTTELSGSLWKFSPCSGEFAGKDYPVTVPCCWESLPDFSAYRGVGVFSKEFQAGGCDHGAAIAVRDVIPCANHVGDFMSQIDQGVAERNRNR